MTPARGLFLAATTVAALAVAALVAGSSPVLELGPGHHAPMLLDTPGQIVRGVPGTVVQGPVTVAADGVEVRDLTITGGDTGLLIREVDGVLIEAVTVTGARMHGIEVVDASARIGRCRVDGLTHPLAQGIEVRNQTGRPHTIIEGCTIVGGLEGIVSHSARVEVYDNEVTRTTRRAIAVLEMSEGLVARNQVHDVTGAALFCGDMSHCEVVSNTVVGVASDGTGVTNQSGFGSVTWYSSTVRHRDNVFAQVAAPEPITIRQGSTETLTWPLTVWPRGWRGLLPGVPLALLLAATGLAVVAGVVRRLRGDRHRRTPVLERGALILFALGVAAQSMHMLEHVVQVWQIHVADAAVHSGLLGQAFDTEWVHLSYNLVVFVFLVGLLVRERAGLLAGRAGTWIAAATVVQTWHLAEHVVKVVQHETLGLTVAPGIVGGRLGLVWFHFTINVAVFAAQALAAGWLVRALVAERPTPRPQAVPV